MIRSSKNSYSIHTLHFDNVMPLKTMAKNIAISFLSFPSFLIGLFDIWTHFLLEVLAGIYVYGFYAPITTHVYVKFNGKDLFARGSGGEGWTRTAKRTVLWWQYNFLPTTITLTSHYVGKLVCIVTALLRQMVIEGMWLLILWADFRSFITRPMALL